MQSIEEKKSSKDIYISEINDSIKKLQEEKSSKQLEYFFKITKEYFNDNEYQVQKIIVLGTSIPEEIIYALKEVPLWIIGGSLGTYNLADEFVPRDTDSVSQSILGFLKRKKLENPKDYTVIIPITCDSMRKLAYILEKEVNVITVDFPTDKNQELSAKKWTSEMWKLGERLEVILKKNITRDSLKKAVKLVNDARYEMRRFRDLTRMNKAEISTTMSLFILNTYYYSKDISRWTQELKKINEFLESKVGSVNYNIPKVLLIGSPIYFPNFKVPFLLNDIGLDIGDTVNVMTEKVNVDSNIENKGFLLRNYFNKVVLESYYSDCSSAYVDNSNLFEEVKKLQDEYNFDGVIYHVLKGQIEHDFELNRYESFFVDRNIPVFRLETDYKYQDIEQIRIRVEAFKEMLIQNLYRQERCN
ncbi:2-hydroxyacyl-CoA dehydratase family protein [uncultured Clostridium sp.]|uniref:2-hydroxyacyl-CoA dehydratase family protein n=1 Tax=uncultured Clostridium sp. TaxID=59620 RepID=UPI0025F10CA9|nr:2-hydroxyacyl-CoA dehydratase family protein [uncultured Clostridium sp.]